MSKDEAYLQILDPREGRGLRKRSSETILNTGRRTKSPRPAPPEADDNERVDERVDHNPLAKGLQPASMDDDYRSISKEPEQDDNQSDLEVDDRTRDDGDMNQIIEGLKKLRCEKIRRRREVVDFVEQKRVKEWCFVCQKFRHTVDGSCIDCRQPIGDYEKSHKDEADTGNAISQTADK